VIVVDTSALVAILKVEPDAAELLHCLGDCFSYGLAKALDAPLLFKGEDFSYIDVKVAH
jgi:ribonuclease VapC